MIERSAQIKAREFENVLPFCVKQLHAGKRVCVITLIKIEGASPRPLGSQIAVAENGQSVGMITGGCAEEALIKRALLEFKTQAEQMTVLRLGTDSPWVDIRLPCGAGIDVHFSFPASADALDQAMERLTAREPCSLLLNIPTGQWDVGLPDEGTNLRSDEVFVRHWDPPTKILILGKGPYVDALVDLAGTGDFQVVRFGTSAPEPEMLDPYSAAVLLMHDHESEPEILEAVLQSDCFYVGALGSRTTHAKRVEQLEARGVSAESIARVHGPVGLPIGARSPHEIALSILAEITMKKYERFQDA